VGSDGAAAAPQRGQCLLPMNINAKHEGHTIVASRELQYWHRGASDETAAPQLGQLRVSACIIGILSVPEQAGLWGACCAMLATKTIKER
jgi:hypothetical protein